MSSYDDIIKRMMETERIIAPLRVYERLYGHNAQQILNSQKEVTRVSGLHIAHLIAFYDFVRCVALTPSHLL